VGGNVALARRRVPAVRGRAAAAMSGWSALALVTRA